MRTVGEITKAARALAAESNTPKAFMQIVVDDVGVGGGVTDRLRELGEFQIVAFNGGNEAITSDYPNRRSELWFTFAGELPRIDLDTDDQVAADLVAPKYVLDSQSRRVVEKKADTKKRLGRSPDRADAVLLTFAAPSPVTAARPGAPAAVRRAGVRLPDPEGHVTPPEFKVTGPKGGTIAPHTPSGKLGRSCCPAG
jgi:hypothetical protein